MQAVVRSGSKALRAVSVNGVAKRGMSGTIDHATEVGYLLLLWICIFDLPNWLTVVLIFVFLVVTQSSCFQPFWITDTLNQLASLCSCWRWRRWTSGRMSPMQLSQCAWAWRSMTCSVWNTRTMERTLHTPSCTSGRTLSPLKKQ